MDEPGHAAFPSERAERLLDPRRLETFGEGDLVRLLALEGNEDVVDLGSGVGFYTDRIAALTTGTVYALDIQPEMHEFYRSRGVPANVRLILGDLTRLDLPPDTVDVAISVATWHETGGVIDVAGLAQALRPGGRVVIVDWRRDVEAREEGPPLDIRFTKDEVAASLGPHFRMASSENLNQRIFAVVAVPVELPAG